MSRSEKLKSSEKLQRRMRQELSLEMPADSAIRRTYAGRHQRAAGAFIWTLETEDRRSGFFGWHVVGSQYTVRELMRARKIEIDKSFGDIGICPV